MERERESILNFLFACDPGISIRLAKCVSFGRIIRAKLFESDKIIESDGLQEPSFFQRYPNRKTIH